MTAPSSLPQLVADLAEAMSFLRTLSRQLRLHPVSADVVEHLAVLDRAAEAIEQAALSGPGPKDRPRRTWSAPARPGPEVTHVTDAQGVRWHREDPESDIWYGRVDRGSRSYARVRTWSEVLMRGPLTDDTPR